MTAPPSLRGLINPFPRQQQFLDALRRHSFVLYGGARGGGKSRILRWAAVGFLVALAAAGVRGARVAIFCQTFPELRERQISKLRLEFPAWLGEWHDTNKEFTLAAAYGSGVICFRNLDDPTKYQSAEFAAMFVDELTKITYETFSVLRGSLRWPGVAHTPFCGATNPGGIGHLWVKQLWIDREYPPELQHRAEEFAFVRSLPSDNPHNGPNYLRELASLPENLRKAWMLGDWNVFAGQFFTEWDPALHVIPPPVWPFPAWWTVAGGMDWGYKPDAGVVLWVAFDQTGRAYGYKELTFREMTPTQVADAILARCTTPAERRMEIYGDTQMWVPQAARANGVSIAQEIQDRLAERGSAIVLRQANKDRFNGWMRVHSWLNPHRPSPDGRGTEPYFRAIRPDAGRGILGMPDLTRTLPALTHRTTGDLADLDTKGADHWADALRYLLMAQPELPAVPLEEQPRVPYHQVVHREVDKRLQRLLRQHNQWLVEREDGLQFLQTPEWGDDDGGDATADVADLFS